MLITAREVARRLEDVGLSRPQSTKVMAVGLAGLPLVTPSATLYDGAAVDRLIARPTADEAMVDGVCPEGLFIARRMVDVRTSAVEQRDVVCGGWAFSLWTAVWLRSRVQRHGSFPLVVTVGGFVVCGADIIDVLPHEGTRRLELREPGGWYGALAEHRLEAGPGSAWAIRGWQLGADRVGRSERQLRPRPRGAP